MMFRIAILAATCMSVNGEVTPASASIINKGGGIDINLADANSLFCIKGGGEVGCLKPTDVVTKGYVENVKTEFMEKTAKQLDERIEVLETDLNGKVAEISKTIAGLCKWGFEYMDSSSNCQAIKECVPGTNYEIKKPTATANRECKNVKQCGSKEFEIVAPGYHSDRVCQKATACDAGVEWLVTAATDTADANCAPIKHCSHLEWEKSGPTANADRVCAAITPCNSNQWTKAVATATTNTECGPLYTATTAKDGGARGRAGDSCDAVHKVRDGKVKDSLFRNEGVWIKVNNKAAAVVCMGDSAPYETVQAGQTLATKTAASCEDLFSYLGKLKDSAFYGKKAGDSVLYYSAKGIKTCKLGSNGSGAQLPHGGKLKDMLVNNKYAGLKASDFVFWIDSIHAQPEGGNVAVDLVNNIEFEWHNRGKSYNLKQDKTLYHNQWYFEGNGYFRKKHADLKPFGLPYDRRDRTLFSWARPSRESGWVNHLGHYGYTGCGRAYGLTYGHYSGKHWVGNHKWCGGNGFRGAEWKRRALQFVGSVMKGGKMRTFTVLDAGGKQRVVWGSQTKNQEHNTYISDTSQCRGYFRIGSRICDWEWFYGGVSSFGVTKVAMTDAQILAVYAASFDWRTKRD